MTVRPFITVGTTYAYAYMFADAYNLELHDIMILDHFWYSDDDSEVHFDAQGSYNAHVLKAHTKDFLWCL